MSCPSDHTSTLEVSAPPCSTSGGRPCIWTLTPYPANVVIEYWLSSSPRSACFIRTPRPRSASLNSPVAARRQLSGLMSLWVTPAAWTSATALASASAASMRSFTGRSATLPPGALRSHCASDSPQRSIAVNTASAASRCTSNKNVTRLLFWFRCRCNATSLSTSARIVAPRSPGGSGILLIAAGLRTTDVDPAFSS
eukprot:31502-Pelagococcus_subviridis.AAC.17